MHANKLTSVGPNILDKLKKLDVVYFFYNTCISAHAFDKNILNLVAELKTKCPPNSKNSQVKTCSPNPTGSNEETSKAD